MLLKNTQDVYLTVTSRLRGGGGRCGVFVWVWLGLGFFVIDYEVLKERNRLFGPTK